MVPVFLLLWDSMKKFLKERERETESCGEEILVSERLKPLGSGFGEYL